MRELKWLGLSLVLIVVLAATLTFGALQGWFRHAMAPQGDSASFMSAATDYIHLSEPANVAFALVEDGTLVDAYYSTGINEQTLFPVASLSKWFTAFAIMKLVDEGKLNVDVPVSTYLTRWQLPPSKFDNDQVTIRRLLSHTAGLTDGLGFADYSESEPLPTLESSLQNPRASSGNPVAIRVGREPGSAFQYSGGGYLILQLLVEEVTGVSFDVYMQHAVFDPLQMIRSTYRYPGELQNVAQSLTASGEVAPFYRYAAAGA
ncbi:MAG: serine hydrolase, partial [Pseudomonadales bacterium]|nr:serine hydrolase [Pseudomonadales bacterium]